MNIFCFDNDLKTEKLIKKVINSEGFDAGEFYFSDKLDDIAVGSGDESMVVFIDTRLQENDKNSFHIATYIRESFPHCHIIFVSLYPEDIHLCLKQLIRPSAFLMKPLSAGEVTEILRQIHQNEKKNAQTACVRIATREYKYNIESKNILYFSTMGKKIYAQMIDGEKIEFYGTISNLEKDYGNFIRCHSGFLVNKLYIKGVKKGELELAGQGETLPISKKYKTNIAKMKTN